MNLSGCRSYKTNR